MKWNKVNETEWHDIFAYYPTQITGTNTVVWLQTIQRRRKKHSIINPWEFREKPE